MQPEPKMMTSTVKVGKRFRCTFAANVSLPMSIRVEWRPDIPRKLKESEQAAYVAGRDAFMAELGTALRQRVGVLDLCADGSTSLTMPAQRECKGRA